MKSKHIIQGRYGVYPINIINTLLMIFLLRRTTEFGHVIGYSGNYLVYFFIVLNYFKVVIQVK